MRNALLDKVQGFLLKIGKGFCFEARNRPILIGSKYRFNEFFVSTYLFHPPEVKELQSCIEGSLQELHDFQEDKEEK